MRAALVLLTSALVVVQASVCAAEIDRPPSDVVAPPPVLIHPSHLVRIRTVDDPSRVPLPLRRQFVGSIAGINQQSLTVVLPGGQPAVVHRDLIAEFETGVDRGSRGAHALMGAGVGLAVGIVLGLAAEEDAFFSTEDLMAMGMMLCAPAGAIVGALCPAGTSWNTVPLESVEVSSDD